MIQPDIDVWRAIGSGDDLFICPTVAKIANPSAMGRRYVARTKAMYSGKQARTPNHKGKTCVNLRPRCFQAAVKKAAEKITIPPSQTM